MRRTLLVFLPVLILLSGSLIEAAGDSKTPPDFPLRVHVYQTRWQKHPGGAVDGHGRANLFEKGQPRGFDYTFNCSEVFRASMGWETYPARGANMTGS